MRKTALRLSGWFASNIGNAIVGAIVGTLLLAGGGVLYLSKTALSYTTAAATISTPLWATTVLALLSCGCIYCILKKWRPTLYPPIESETLIEAYHVYWNPKYKMRCLNCKWPLKASTIRRDPSVFFCSNCNCKHALRDEDGTHLTEAQAIDRLHRKHTAA